MVNHKCPNIDDKRGQEEKDWGCLQPNVDPSPGCVVRKGGDQREGRGRGGDFPLMQELSGSLTLCYSNMWDHPAERQRGII